MKKLNIARMVTFLFLTIACFAVHLSAQDEPNMGVGQAVITIVPKVEGKIPASVSNQDFSVKVNGKNAKVSVWKPLNQPDNRVELVILMDSSARTSLGGQLNAMAAFFDHLPPNTSAAIGYMWNGNTQLAVPFTTDPAQLKKGLHLPGGSAGSNGSPYFCLSQLVNNWPSKDPNARREVLMLTDGRDPYHGGVGTENPYIQAAMNDASRARVIVDSIYWANQGIADSTMQGNNNGQNQLSSVAEATGGKDFWHGFGNPVSIEPYLDELTRRLRNQYELQFVVPHKGKPEVESMHLKLSAPGTEVNSPAQVYVVPQAQDSPNLK